MQVCQHICHLKGTSCILCACSSIAPCAAGFTLTCGQGYNIVQALMRATTLLPRTTCPLLDHTPSIGVGTVNDVDVLSDIVSSLSHTQHHPQLVPLWAEVCLHSTS